MNKLESVLKRWGLLPNEIKVYIATIGKDGMSPSELAKITNIPRTTIYDILLSLSLKNLVVLEQSDGFTKQQTIVHSKDPSQLRNEIRNKRKELNNLEIDIINVLSSLKDKYDNSALFPFTTFPGLKGAKKVYLDNTIYLEDGVLYSWDRLFPSEAFGAIDHQRAIEERNQMRKKGLIFEKKMYPLTEWTRHVVTIQTERNPAYNANSEIRLIPSETYALPTRICIKGDFVSITSLEEDDAWGMMGRSKALATTFKTMFEVMWTTAIPLTPELIKSWGKNPLFRTKQKS